MSDAPKDPTTVFAEELAKQLPVKAVYRDAVKPAAKQLGQIAQDIVKTIQLALAPLQVAGAYQDRLRAFLDRHPLPRAKIIHKYAVASEPLA